MDDGGRSVQTRIEELQRAIAALEAQQVVLGEAVVAEARAAMQAKLDVLRDQASEQRKLLTVLFADLVGFTALSEKLDPEDVRALQQDYFARWRQAIEQQGGVLEKFIGDAVMALFGVPAAREDDPERAVRAALGLHAALATMNAARGTTLQMRAGVHTGPVLVSGAGGEFVATGDTVNVAARLQANAPPGGTLISHDLYQHVRGLFEVAAQPPLALKGKSEPLQTYLVERPLPAGFRAMARGVEGVETRMVGREAELLILQKAYEDAAADRTARLALVVADPGLGKSRLAYEFGLWLVDQPQMAVALRARATPQSSAVPAAALHSLFSRRFAIDDTDSAAEAAAKFRAGTAGQLEADQADILGQFCGFDFSTSAAVRRLLGRDELAHLGREYLGLFFERLGQTRPVVLLVEDLHWADDRSLDALLTLVAPRPLEVPLLIIGLTRPSLFERRPHWTEGLETVTRLALKPLSRRESRALVAEILQKVADLPADLRDLIVAASEGNPFFAEELVKMLVDDGVIVIEPASQTWRVVAERAAQVRVPATLAGVLQARLDSLPRPEREALQRAAVVGREFWQEAVARLSEAQSEQLSPILAMLRSRELIYRHERSAFAETAEFAFKHAVLRDVTYGTVLKRLRRTYHRQVAEWLEQRTGGRLAEYAGLIAYHYQQAEVRPQALQYLTLAAETSLARYANTEAAAYYRQALELEPSEAVRATLLDGLGRAQARQGDYSQAVAAWREAIGLYHALGDANRTARLYARTSRALWNAADAGGGLATARAGLEALASAPVSPGLAALYHEAGRAAFYNGQADEAYHRCQIALEMAQEIHAVDVEADTLATLGLCPQLSMADRLAALRRSVELAESSGLLAIAQRANNNLATALSFFEGDQAAAVAAYRRAFQIARQRGAVGDQSFFLSNLVTTAGVAGDLQAASEAVDASRRLALAQPDSQALKAAALSAEAEWQRYRGNLEQAILLWHQCSAYYEAADDPQSLGWHYWHLGTVELELGALADAEAWLTRAIEIDARRSGPGARSWPRAYLAGVRVRQGRLAEADTLLHEAGELVAGEGVVIGAALLPAQAWLAAARSEWDAALAYWQAAIDQHRKAGQQTFSVRWTKAMAETYLARGASGDREQARELLGEALAAYKAMNATGYVARLEAQLQALDAGTSA